MSRNLPEPGQQNDGTASDIALVRNLMADQREDEAIAVSPGQAAAITRTSRLRAGNTLNRRRFIAGGAAVIVSAAGIAWLAEEPTGSGSPQPLPASHPFPAHPAFTFRAKANVADAVFDRTGSYLAWGGRRHHRHPLGSGWQHGPGRVAPPPHRLHPRPGLPTRR